MEPPSIIINSLTMPSIRAGMSEAMVAGSSLAALYVGIITDIMAANLAVELGGVNLKA